MTNLCGQQTVTVIQHVKTICEHFPDLPHHGGNRDVTPELSSLEEEDLSPGN
jgi:hypothetical protein